MIPEYAMRDTVALDEAGGFYSRHVSAMTTEALHDKSAIAAELGYRDQQLAAEKARADALEVTLACTRTTLKLMIAEYRATVFEICDALGVTERSTLSAAVAAVHTKLGGSHGT